MGDRSDRSMFGCFMSLRIGLSSGALYPHVVTEDAPAVAASWGARDLELMLQTHGEYQRAGAGNNHREDG